MEAIYLKGSNQRAILLLHAYTSSSVDVRLLGTTLNQQGYTVYMPTISGHGTNDMKNILAVLPKQFQEDVQVAIEFLKTEGYKQIAVFGLSMGGMLAIDAMTKKNPAIIGGGSFNSPVPLENFDKVHQQFMIYADKLYQDSFGDKVIYQEELRKNSFKQLSEISNLTYDVYDSLSHIEVPVFIVQSGKDELISETTGEKLAQAMRFAPVEYHYFPDATHAITVGKYRVELSEKLLNFINSLDWSV